MGKDKMTHTIHVIIDPWIFKQELALLQFFVEFFSQFFFVLQSEGGLCHGGIQKKGKNQNHGNHCFFRIKNGICHLKYKSCNS